MQFLEDCRYAPLRPAAEHGADFPDGRLLAKNQLIEMGIAWADYLDKVKAGKDAEPPHFA